MCVCVCVCVRACVRWCVCVRARPGADCPARWCRPGDGTAAHQHPENTGVIHRHRRPGALLPREPSRAVAAWAAARGSLTQGGARGADGGPHSGVVPAHGRPCDGDRERGGDSTGTTPRPRDPPARKSASSRDTSAPPSCAESGAAYPKVAPRQAVLERTRADGLGNELRLIQSREEIIRPVVPAWLRARLVPPGDAPEV